MSVLKDFDLDAGTLEKVNDFVDDDLLSCFLWAAGENAVAQPGWESPSVNPLKGIPLPPLMPSLPPAAPSGGPTDSHATAAAPAAGASTSNFGLPPLTKASDGREGVPAAAGGYGKHAPGPDSDDDAKDLDEFKDLDDDDIDDISKMGVPLSKEQKLTQRMQRKAESARVARLRKKEYVTGLEDQIKDLQREVRVLREGNKAAAGAAQPPKLREEGQRHLAQMDELLKQPTMERHVPDVNAAVERYVANKRAKQETINEYLDCIEDFLSPAAPLQVAFNPSSSLADAAARSMNASPAPGGPTTQMLAATRPGGGESLLGPGIIKRDPMHHLAHDEVALPPAIAAIKSEALAALSPLPPPTPPVPVPAPAPAPVPAPVQQTSTAGASNGTSEGEGEGVPAAKRQRRETVGSQLLGALSQELGLTSPQVDALSGQKEFIKADREIVQQCIRLIKELRSRVSEHVKTSQGITDGLRRILTPVQVAKFLMWVEKHQKSMDMLNSMLAE